MSLPTDTPHPEQTGPDADPGNMQGGSSARQTGRPRRTMGFAAQELRLISALVVLLSIGLFLALPFVLSIGSVVFLPLVAAIVLTIVLSPLADRLAMFGIPNYLASFAALLAFLGILALALTAVLSPAVSMLDEVPAMIARIGEHFSHLQGSLAWLTRLNEQIAGIVGGQQNDQVVLAGPTVLQQLALATPSVVLEVLLTFLMAFFMIEARVRLRRRLLLERQHFGASLKAARVMRAVQDRVAAYILTVGLINLGVGLIVAFGAWALGLGAPVMWGGLAALLNFLPYIGPLTMIALLTLFGLGTADSPVVGLIPAAAYLGLHTVESNLVTPAILGARFTMNPVLILLALSYFSWIWGVTGALLSVPILLTITALVDHLGRPNLVGFIFGEPLFSTDVLELGEAD
ncbi:putative PurR-regulated permease PerM [Altererythrobacter atlanticus]|uniref:Pheromone autoinducer 2 transporter n=1 Tax=Croceibacterium atlanticum TaxID=1267766 RepID=A0A0F7KQ16_9SPHN|nr:AI-2E family transporter [Croceibacterium atlanticum]AKH42628.1 pheromone autoinducer 2 transporter [Croceibacterium atlanticum]MBB5731405.1 putative PurR-regulated permease PerM [Croceibacterium atlanticum]